MPEKKRSLKDAEVLAQKLHQDVKEKIETKDTFKEKRKVIQDCAFQHSDATEAKYNWGYIVIYHDREKAPKSYTREFLEAAKTTPVGELSDVIRTKHGYGFFLVKNQFSSNTHSFDSDTIQKMLPNMIREEEMKKWHDELKEKFQFKGYYDRLKMAKYDNKIVMN